MKTWIALLRGINVGGNNPLPMKNLIAIMQELGCVDVKTYIQSGNAVFRKSRLNPQKFGNEMGKAINSLHGFEPRVLVISASEIQAAVLSNPFPDAESNPKSLHVLFMSEMPKHPDLELLDSIKAPSESYELTDKLFYLHAPAGVARSKLASRVEKLLAVDATGRNWRTVVKLREMVGLEGIDSDRFAILTR